MNVLFCPRCHKRIEPPRIQIMGEIKGPDVFPFNCPLCKKGVIMLKYSMFKQKGGADQGDNKKEIQEPAGTVNPADSKIGAET